MNYPLLNVFLTTMWVFLWILWIFLLVRVFMDLFRDHSLGGWAKAGWSVFLICLPFLGVFVYLIARGRTMNERERRQAEQSEEAFRAYVRQTAADNGATPASGHADDLARLAGLREHGDISEAEYQRAKTKVLA